MRVASALLLLCLLAAGDGKHALVALAQDASMPVASTFQLPLRGGSGAPDHARFGVVNPFLAARSTCFGGAGHLFNQLVHAGEDWFRPVGTPVYPIAAGRIRHIHHNWDHGDAIVVEHRLPESQPWGSDRVFSVYLHAKAKLAEGAEVGLDTELAEISSYVINGVENHHLHWEVRRFASMHDSSLTSKCKSVIGPSYTDAGTTPQDFGYLPPSDWVRARQQPGTPGGSPPGGPVTPPGAGPVTPPGAGPVTPPAANPGGTAATASALVFDVSGSMGENDPSGQTKIEAARQAARRLTSMMRAENERGTAHQAGVVSFSDKAEVRQPLGIVTAALEQAIGGLAASGPTNLAAGLQRGGQILAGAGSARKILILLSDGVPTVSLDGSQQASMAADVGRLREEVLNQVLPAVAKQADCIYVIGFGDAKTVNNGIPSLDEDLLRQIGGATGCGNYFNITTAGTLSDVYVRLRHESTGTLHAEQNGTISQGQTLAMSPFDVPDGRDELYVSLNWPGSQLDLSLIDPSGRQVNATYPGATVVTDRLPTYAIIRSPAAGRWQAQIYGADVPTGSTAYSFVASSRGAAVSTAPMFAVPAAAPRSRGLGGHIIWLVVGAAVVAGLLVMMLSRGRVPASVGGHHFGVLEVAGDSGPRRRVSIRRLPLTIGRHPSCDIVLNDPEASRHHARIVRMGRRLLLEDLGSTSGTRVDGARVHVANLHPGANVHVGRTRLRLLEGNAHAS